MKELVLLVYRFPRREPGCVGSSLGGPKSIMAYHVYEARGETHFLTYLTYG